MVKKLIEEVVNAARAEKDKRNAAQQNGQKPATTQQKPAEVRGQGYSSQASRDILAKYGMAGKPYDTSRQESGRGYSSTDSRRLLAKYGLADYSEEEMNSANTWYQRLNGYNEKLGSMKGSGNTRDRAVFVHTSLDELNKELDKMDENDIMYRSVRDYRDYLLGVEKNLQRAGDYEAAAALRDGGKLQGAADQLGKTEYSDWENDDWYRVRLDMERARTQKALDDYKGGGDYGAEWDHQRLQNYMDYLNRMEEGYQNRQEYFGQFGSEDNYNAYTDIEPSWERAQQRGLTRRQWHEEVNAQAENAYTEIEVLEDIEIPRLQREINRAESGMQADGNRYDDYMDATREAEALKQELQDAQARLENAYTNARKYGFQRQFTASLQFSDLPEMEGWEEGLEERRAEAEAASAQAQEERRQDINLGDLFDAPEASYYEFPQADWTQEEKDIFAWYYHNDPETAKKIAVELNTQHRADKWSETQGEVYQFGHDNLAVSAPLGTAASILTSPWGLIDWFGQTIDYMASGYEMPRDTFSPRDYATTLAAGAGARMNEWYTIPDYVPIIGGKGVGDAYQLGNNILESVAWGKVAKGLEAITGSQKIGSAVVNLAFFGNAASETTQQALLRGVPSDQAFWLGFSAGASEALFETISIESRVHLSQPGTWRTAVINSLKQAGVEASEEFNTTMANTLFEAWIMGGESEYNEKVRQNIMAGMTREEAENAAWHDWADGLLYDTLGGFLSGGITGGFNQGARMIQGSRTEYSGTDREALLQAALQMDQKSPAYALAQKIQQQGTMSYNEALQLKDLMGERAELVSREVSDRERADIQQRAESALKDAGVENPGAAAQLIAKQVMGEELTRDERRVLKGVQQAEQVSTALQEQVRQETNFRRYQAQLMRQDVKKQNAARKKGADTRTTTVKGEKGAVKIEELTVENGRTMAKVTGTDGKSRTVAFSSLELDDYQRRALNTFRQVLGRDAIAAYNSLGSENIYSMSAYDIMQQAIAWGNIRNMFGAKTTDAAKSLQAALASQLRGKLSDAQVEQAFEIGRKHAQEEKTERPKSKRGTGHVSLDGGTVDGMELKGIRNKDQVKRSKEYRAVKAIAKALGIDVVLFESEAVNKAGDLRGIQGAYLDGVIYLDWNAGMKNLKQVGSRMLLRTMSHELTHFIQQNAPELYEELKDYVTGYLADKMGADFNDLVAQKMNGRNVDRDGAIDEVVADACETMLRDSQAVKDLVQNHRSLWQSIKDFVLKYVGNITAEDTGAIYMQDAIQELQEIWGRGLKAAVENRTDVETGKTSTEVGSIDLADYSKAKGTDGKPLFQVRAFEHDEPQYREMLRKWGGMSTTEIDELFNTVDVAMAKIMKNLEALDYAWEEDIDDRGFQAIKQNSDKLYKVSLDFSTLCRKRLLQGLIAGQLSAALQRGLSKEEGIAVRDALLAIQAEGKQIEVACALCYVESARMRSQKAIQEFLNDREGALRNYYANQHGREAVAKAETEERQAIYNELLRADKAAGKPMSEWGLVRGKGDDTSLYDIRDTKKAKMSKIPTAMKKRIQDAKKAARTGYALTAQQQATLDYANSLPVEAFTTPEGLQDLAKSKYRDVFNAFVLKVSAASKSKGIENDTWWRAGDSQAIGDLLIKQMNAENGLRTQSWSDFTVKHLMDYIAATIELSTRGAKQHAYTKVLDYVDLMGNTGLMINMSLIPARDYNGKLEYDDVEGINYKEALKMREKFPDTAGTICIGITVDQVHQLLESMEIDYVIPYHSSGMSKDTRKLMHIPAWENFQDYQSEKKLSGSAARENARKYGVELLSESDPLWHQGPSFSEWFDLGKAKATAKRVGKTGKYGVMTGGYAAMQEAAENYKRICAQRGLAPKFSYGSAAFNADFSKDAGYWKLLIDRKMVNNKTGEIIEQRALKPIFKFGTVERILNDELKRYGRVKADQDEAIQRVTRAFLTGDVKAGMSSDEIAKVMQKPVDNIPITNITQNAAQMSTRKEALAVKGVDWAENSNTLGQLSVRDREYSDAVARGDMETAQMLVNRAAMDAGVITNKSGRGPMHLYHGTPSFGFTEFRPGMIFLTDNQSIAAGYTANKGYGRKRRISETYTQDDGATKTLLKNIKNVLGKNYREANQSDAKEIAETMRKASDKMNDKVNDAWQNEAMDALGEILGDAYTDEFENKLYTILALPGSINENLDYIFENPDSPITEDIRRDLDRWDDYRNDIRPLFVEHHKELTNSAAKGLRDLIIGFDLSDYLIDAQHSMLKALDIGNMLISEAGSLVSKDSMREAVEQAKDIGSYDLYALAGDNPLVIDGNGAFWTNIEVPELGGTFMTDEIGKLAKEKGYTSVQIKNIMDSSMNNYASNVNSDVFIFFDSSQVKSADPVTYDDKGNVIPLSQRFDSGKSDIRYSVRGKYKGVEEAAIQHFGMTDNFRIAGYILQDGKMLDFSGAHWLDGYDEKYIAEWRKKNDIRQVDHEDVYEAFEQISDNPPSDAALAFINRGNIRVVPEVPGLELSGTTEPTAAQYRQIKAFIREIANDPKHYNSKYFSIDITKDRTHKAGALKYEGNINADRVINDIKHYYQTGEIREQGLGAFYSMRSDAKTDRELLAGVTAQTVMSERLQQENEILRESVRDLRKLLGQRDSALDKLRRQLRLTKSPELRLNDAKRMTRSLLQDYDSRADAARIAQEVKELGEFILGTELTGEAYDQELDRRLGSIARQVVENAKAEFTEGTDVYKEIASRIKGEKISVDAGNLGDLGDFGAFRKSLFGKLIVSQRAANTRENRADYTSADQMYAELQADYGETIFPTALNEGEELQNIARALELAKPTEANPFAQDMRAAEESVRNRVLMDLYSGALELEAPTAADRAKSRRKALQDQIKQLQRENRLSEKESQRMAEQIYALDTALDKARSQYETLLRENSSRRSELENYKQQLERYEQKEREVSQALNELDALVKEGTDADAVNKQRARLSDKERQMTEALQAVTKAQQSPALQQILQRERAIERTRTRERIREGVNRRDLRQRVERLWKDMNRRITSPTEKKHIPVSVMQQAIEVLQALNMDTSREGTKSGEKLRSKLTELKARYEALQKDPDYRQAAMYDTQVAEYLTYMIEQVGDTPINKMSVAQLETVYRTLTALDHVARHALRLKLGEEERSAYEVSQAMTRETRSVPKAKTGLAAAWLNAQLSAERMFRRLGGYHKNSTWEQVYRMLNDGQLRQTQIQMEGSMIFADLLAAKDYGKFVDPGSTVDIGLKDEDGNPVKITHGMMVSLWMHLQNEQNRRHVAFGGLTIPGLKDYYNGKKVKGSERAIRIGGALQELAEINDRLQALEESDSASADEIAELEAQRDEVSVKALEYVESLQESIEKQLTDYDRQWIAACRELFDGLSKRVLNQTTLEVYGIKRANVENYFPIWVDGDFLNTPFETVARDLSLENAGFMKERVDSSKPIRLADVSDVAASQIRKVSQYAGLMPAIRNFGKVWGKTQTGYRDSLRKAVHETFGQNGVNYIEHLIADLNGARSKENDAVTEFFNRMRGHMAQASLTMSLRVAMGQTASYPTAAAVVGWKALHKALWRGGRNNWLLSRADKELIQKYSPLLYYRMKGYSNTELGDIAGMNDKWSRLWKKARWLTGWIQAMDGATVGRLWYAAEYYVQDHNKDLQKGTDAYYEAVAKVFNDIVERTQPNYSTMQRPDILRNPSSLVKQLTMFLTQRLQNFNILYDAFATHSTLKADYKAGRNGVTLEDVRQAAMETRRACVSQVAAGITITVFKTLADIVLHSLNAYRDDDDKELKAESISWELLDMFIDSMTGNVLGGSELWDIAESLIPVFNKTYYGIEVSGMAVVQDMISASMNLFTKITNGEATGKDYENVIRQFCTVLGIPYANGKKFFNAGKYWIQDAVNGEWLFESEAGVDRTTAMQAHRLYRAYQDKDFGKANKIRGQFPEDKQKDLDEAVREYIKDQYKAGDITVYEAMRQLQSYGNASPTVMANFIKDEYKAGNLQKGDAVKYLVEYAGRSQESAEKTVRELSAERDTGVKYSEINDQYMMGEISGQQATQMLVDYGGKDPETAALMVEFWDFQNKHPGSEMEFSQYQTYTNKYKPIGLSPEQYEDYAKRIKDCKGVDADGDGKTDSGSKKIEVVALIDSMDLTPAQKDQMYLANNYSESGLKDCPWNNGRSTTYVDKYGKGNIDLTDRNTGLYDNNGRLMTVKSMSFEEDGIEILIPTIVKQNGKWVELSEEDAIDWYHRTGEYLGKFNSVAEANAYAEQLHRDQERMYGNR